jgi:hypothetical protein
MPRACSIPARTWSAIQTTRGDSRAKLQLGKGFAIAGQVVGKDRRICVRTSDLLKEALCALFRLATADPMGMLAVQDAHGFPGHFQMIKQCIHVGAR